MIKLSIYMIAFASAALLVPYAGQVVVGAATTTAKVNDTVKVGIAVEQVDTGLTELNVSVPYTPGSLEYIGLEGDGLTANNVVVDDARGSVNVSWTGMLGVGETRHLGYVLFRVKKADKSEFQGVGVNPDALDGDGLAVDEIEVVNSQAIVQLSPRPLRLLLDLIVQ